METTRFRGDLSLVGLSHQNKAFLKFVSRDPQDLCKLITNNNNPYPSLQVVVVVSNRRAI